MDLFFRLNLPTRSCKDARFFLACSFVIGLLAGACGSIMASESFFSMMRAADFGRVSIVGLLSAMLLPFLFSAFAVYIRQSWLLIPIAFLKAFGYGFLYVTIGRSFGNAGWLIRCLLMCSDMLMMPVLWWFWLRILSEKRSLRFCAPVLAAAAIAIGCFDFTIVSPLAAKLIS